MSNNLPLSLVERQSFIDLIHNINPAINIGSARTLRQELSQQLHYHQEMLKHNFLIQIIMGGSIIFDDRFIGGTQS